MNRDRLITSTIITAVVLATFFLVYAVVKNSIERNEELSKVCRAVNYELVTIKGRHYCLPFMPEQER